ncbi:AaceriAAR128Wp [[Ashbya] aceris (nom. inval.)]|nr:AaceriAAR128Wp [[Ashbya] aceris (nom. inval.)]
MLMFSSLRASLALTGAGFQSQLRLLSKTAVARQAAGGSEAEASVTINPSLLKIVPDTSDIVQLEKQDELIQRRRKLSKEITKMRKLKPVSPGLRWFRAPIYPHLHKGKPERSLTVALKSQGGRNHSGKITVRHRGGGHKRRLRIVDMARWESGEQTVQRIEYDPGRTAHIALLKHNETGKLSYILACDGLRAGDTVASYRRGVPASMKTEMGGKVDPAILSVRTAQRGNCLPISMIPIGSIIHNVGITPVGPGKFCRAAGTYARVMTKIADQNKAVIRLQSGEHRYVSLEACATLGVVSNIEHQNASLGKAGRARWRGIRPGVRGVAMNKCDHPHGGGRGKSKSNKLSMSPWGTLAKGYKTRRGKRVNRMKVKDRPRGTSSRSRT